MGNNSPFLGRLVVVFLLLGIIVFAALRPYLSPHKPARGLIADYQRSHDISIKSELLKRISFVRGQDDDLREIAILFDQSSEFRETILELLLDEYNQDAKQNHIKVKNLLISDPIRPIAYLLAFVLEKKCAGLSGKDDACTTIKDIASRTIPTNANVYTACQAIWDNMKDTHPSKGVAP